MEPLNNTPFLSLRNVPFWMGLVLLAVIVGLVGWPR